MDMKGKLGNVAFGGGWTEEMLDRVRLRSVLDTLDRAADGCADADMRSEELEVALNFVETNVEKGAALAEAFRTALAFGEPWRRREAALLAARRIRRWAESAT